jgi:hypothetical protein
VRRGFILLGALAAAAGAGCAARPELRWLPAGGESTRGLFEAGPLPEGRRRALAGSDIDSERGAQLLAVHVRSDATGGDGRPAMAGSYRLAGDRLQFEPRFALEPGVRYRAVFLPGAAGEVTLELALPTGNRTFTTVMEAIYPSAGTLPENLLKFYLRFSAPMSRGQVWDRLRLIDGSGAAVDMPFLEIDEELWDPSTRRLTVLIDPGRIKRGVRPLEEVGPALVEGGSYVLEVLGEWEDAEGKPLVSGFRKAFRVGPPDREPPDPARWTITPPAPGSREPLTVRLDEPLDHGLLHSAIRVAGPGGEPIGGRVLVGNEEQTWSFLPAQAWAQGEHHLVIATTLEDLAGNSIGRPFEVDVVEPVGRRLELPLVRLPFRPRGEAAE